MLINHARQRLNAWQSRQKVWWMTIAVFAIVMAYADGFWVTSLQGAVGAIERRQPPLERWLRDSTLMVPLYVLAVLAAVLMARRLVGQGHSKIVRFGTTALLIVLLSSAVATAEVAASSAYDYHLQTRHLELQHASHTTLVAAQPGSTAASAGACTGTCAIRQNTFDTHVRAVMYGSLMMLLTNLVLVVWVLALRGNRLWRQFVRSTPPATSTAPQELSLV
jgi:hypothetical protein